MHFVKTVTRLGENKSENVAFENESRDFSKRVQRWENSLRSTVTSERVGAVESYLDYVLSVEKKKRRKMSDGHLSRKSNRPSKSDETRLGIDTNNRYNGILTKPTAKRSIGLNNIIIRNHTRPITLRAYGTSSNGNTRSISGSASIKRLNVHWLQYVVCTFFCTLSRIIIETYNRRT